MFFFKKKQWIWAIGMLSYYLYFLGKKCESNINDCIGSSCANGGTCIDETNGFVCNCANGFKGINNIFDYIIIYT